MSLPSCCLLCGDPDPIYFFTFGNKECSVTLACCTNHPEAPTIDDKRLDAVLEASLLDLEFEIPCVGDVL